jgi:MtN3 and saliva related transmembrane protein
MIIAEIIGFIATILSVVAFIPQAVKSWKTKSTKDISLGMYSIFTTSQILWFTYGILIISWPLIVANAIIFSLSFIILVHKLKYK